MLSRQFALAKQELDSERVAFLADEHGVTGGTVVASSTDLTAAESSTVTEVMGSDVSKHEIVSDTVDINAAVIDRLFPSANNEENLAAKPRFSFNPTLLVARDRWSQAWTKWVLSDEQQQPAVVTASAQAVADDCSPAAEGVFNLNDSLRTMKIEKPLKWAKSKEKVHLFKIF